VVKEFRRTMYGTAKLGELFFVSFRLQLCRLHHLFSRTLTE
jgi:hypothetical protein